MFAFNLDPVGAMMKVLFVALMLLVSTSARSESWESMAAWVKSLNPTEQRIALVGLSGRVAKNLEATVYPNIKGNPSNLLWALKINAISDARLSELATQSPELASFFRERAESLTLVIRGEQTFAVYTNASNGRMERFRKVIEGFDSQEVGHFEQAYGERLTRIANMLIATSKLVAAPASDAERRDASHPSAAEKKQ